MKACTQCGAAANDGALKCPGCKAWLVAVGPPGATAPASAPQPAAPSWSPPASVTNAPAPVGAFQEQAPAYQGAPQAFPGHAPAYQEPTQTYQAAPPGHPAQAPAYQGAPQGHPAQAPEYQDAPQGFPGQAPAYQGPPQGHPAQAQAYQDAPQGFPGQAPAYQGAPQGYPAQAPAYQGSAQAYRDLAQASPDQPPAYQEQPQAYQSVALADGDLFPRRAAAPGPAPMAPTNSWQASTYPGAPAQPKGRLSLRGLPKITFDRERAKPFIIGGCALVVVIAGLWFFLGRGHSSHAPATAAHPKTAARPHGTAKQRAQANRAAQADLRNALTAEKVAYTDQGAYVGSPAAMRAIEGSVAWGTRLHLGVGDAVSRGDRQVVCLSETTRYGDRLSIGDIAAGPAAGTYGGTKPCPARPTAASVRGLGRKLG
jgi:hypothetical protein